MGGNTPVQSNKSAQILKVVNNQAPAANQNSSYDSVPGLTLFEVKNASYHHQRQNSSYDLMSKEGLSSTSTGRTHKNIRFNPKMDEWGVLVRLQDFEAEKKKQAEIEKMKQNRINLNQIYQKQIQERKDAQNTMNLLTKQIDRQMIEKDLAEQEADTKRKRDLQNTARQIALEKFNKD